MADLPYGARVGMEPVRVRLAICANGDADSCKVSFDPKEGTHSHEFAEITFSFDGEVAEVAMVPAVPLVLAAYQFELRHAFSSDEQMLLNGYQSWTDTVERSPWARMRGLRGVPSPLVLRKRQAFYTRQ